MKRSLHKGPFGELPHRATRKSSVVAKCAHHFLLDHFCAPSFHREIFDDELWSFLSRFIADNGFREFNELTTVLSFHDPVSGNLFRQFILQRCGLHSCRAEFARRGDARGLVAPPVSTIGGKMR
jgi:hypothetical protein